MSARRGVLRLINKADGNGCLSQLIHSEIRIMKQQDGLPIASPEEEIGNTSSDTASGVEGRPSLEQLWQKFSMKLGTADAVHASLREGILSGVLQPGERLAEERFARMFEVSRTPIHEAIVRLASEHLAVRLGRRGFVVRRVAESDVQKLYLVRSMLDGLAASIAAKTALPSEITHLRWINEQMATAPDVFTQHAYSAQWHEALIQISKNEILIRFQTEMLDLVRTFGHFTFAQSGRLEILRREHEEIIDAIAQRNSYLAEQLARAHIEDARKFRLSIMRAESTDEEEK